MMAGHVIKMTSNDDDIGLQNKIASILYVARQSRRLLMRGWIISGCGMDF
jgi:hypothetical protein